MPGSALTAEIEDHVCDYAVSRLARLFSADLPPHVIKFVNSKWAKNYVQPGPLWISATPALTWGTGTYVTPLAYPLSTALYGRVGLVCSFDPTGWRIFDASDMVGQTLYLRWVRSQPDYPHLVLTVHSTVVNHQLRNRFRRRFRIDCVVFPPDQSADLHTDRQHHVWLLVTDWTRHGAITSSGESGRFPDARLTVVVDEEFALTDRHDLPVRASARLIEAATEQFSSRAGMSIVEARRDPQLAARVLQAYTSGAFMHLWIEP